MARPGRYGELLLLDPTVYEGPVVPFGRPSDVVDLQGKNFKAIVKTLERVRKNTDLLDNILANLIPKGETQREIGGPLIFPYATTPANWASWQVYWNETSDTMMYRHGATEKRVGLSRILRNRKNGPYTLATPTALWPELHTELRIVHTPVQKCLAIAVLTMDLSHNVVPGANGIYARPSIGISNPSDHDQYTSQLGGTNSGVVRTYSEASGTLTAGTEYTFMVTVNSGPNVGTLTGTNILFEVFLAQTA